MTHACALNEGLTTRGRQLSRDFLPARRISHIVVFVCVTLISAASQAAAQAGHLDTTFGTGGIFSLTDTTGSGSFNSANAVALQSDGKIVVAGQLGSRSALLRLNANGSLDTTFGSGGTVITRIGSNIQQVFVGLAIQSDGKIVVAATGVPPRGAAARFNADGSLDTTFGTAGVVSLPLAATGLALQLDGRIIVTGVSLGTGLMTRLLTDGGTDTTFGTNGLAALVAGPSSIALQSDGKILIGAGGLGAAPVLNPTPIAGSVARYNTNGSLDTSFGISGQAASVVAPSAVAVQSDGKILAVGANVSRLSVTGNSSGFGVVRFNPNGSIDTTFGSKGGVTTGFPTTTITGAFAVAIQSDGDIVAAGEAGNNTSQLVESFALARYLGTGRLDSTFGKGGLVTTSLGSNADALISSLALLNDGKIVSAGTNGGGTLEVARYLGQ